MTNTAQHTQPLGIGNTHIVNGEWVTTILNNEGSAIGCIYGSKERSGYTDEGESASIAESIIKAVNCHEQLVEALKLVVQLNNAATAQTADRSLYRAAEKAKAALSAAEAQ